jgi:hypothetical protein
MADPFTVRLGEQTMARLKRHSARGQVPPRTLAQRYIDEGLRRDEHPLIRFADGPAGRRAALVGSGLDVGEVITTVRDNDGGVKEAAAYLAIPVHLVEAAVTYYGAFQGEVDAWIDANERDAEDAHAAWVAGQRAVAR